MHRTSKIWRRWLDRAVERCLAWRRTLARWLWLPSHVYRVRARHVIIDGDIESLQHFLNEGGRGAAACVDDAGSPLLVRVACDGRALTGEDQALAMARLLLARGAKVDAADAIGRTALFYAASWKTPRLIELLLAAGADPSVGCRYGITPLQVALGTCRSANVLALLRGGVSADQRDGLGRHALHLAVSHGHAPLLNYLLLPAPDGLGVNVNVYDDEKLTPLAFIFGVDIPRFPNYDGLAVAARLLRAGIALSDFELHRLLQYAHLVYCHELCEALVERGLEPVMLDSLTAWQGIHGECSSIAPYLNSRRARRAARAALENLDNIKPLEGSFGD
jgi:hypothetical protein